MKKEQVISHKNRLKVLRIDPICGMNIENLSTYKSFHYEGEMIFFCGEYCRDRFKNNPGRFHGKPLIQMKNVCKNFQMGSVYTKVLRNLDLHIWEGDFVAIIGASGSGKSTALNMIGLLDRQSSGKIFLQGKDVSLFTEDERAELRSKTFGFVFQQYHLIPWLTAYENVCLPLLFAGKNAEPEKITGQYKKIGLSERMSHRPSELSGGEQQRVALLRALVNNPKIIIGDEPTGNLDSVTGNLILNMLIDLNKKEKKTLIIVTHDASIAEKADQIIVLKDGQAQLDHHSQKKLYTD